MIRVPRGEGEQYGIDHPQEVLRGQARVDREAAGSERALVGRQAARACTEVREEGAAG